MAYKIKKIPWKKTPWQKKYHGIQIKKHHGMQKNNRNTMEYK